MYFEKIRRDSQQKNADQCIVYSNKKKFAREKGLCVSILPK